MQGFKSAILAIFQSWQNGTFEPVHGIKKKKKMAKRLSAEAL
jgi:hypothetical protein